jgi:putative transposase
LGTRQARDRFVKILDQVRRRFGFWLIGYVVMPEHEHLLISEPKTGNPSTVLQVLKQKASRELGKSAPLKAKGAAPARSRDRAASDSHTHLWQRRFYDFNVWSFAKIREKLEYMHANPVKRKLVEHPKDWPWSSWSYYENIGDGLITIDSAEGAKQNPNPHP